MPIIVRYVFAIFLGVAVSHPLVLLWFNDTINERITQDATDSIHARLDQAEAAKSNLSEVAKLADLQRQRHVAIEQKQCLTSLQTYEQAGGGPVSLPCGRSTGDKGCAGACTNLLKSISDAQITIDRLDQQIQPLQTQLMADTKVIDEQASQDVTKASTFASYDYLARVNALSNIAKTQPQVTYVELFMIVFIVFVDVLPITMKLATPAGEYEQIKDTLLQQRQIVERSKRAVAEGTEYSEAMAQLHAEATYILDQTEMLTDVSKGLVTNYTRRSIELTEKLIELNESVDGDQTRQANLRQHRISMIDLDKAAWDASIRKLTEYMNKQ